MTILVLSDADVNALSVAEAIDVMEAVFSARAVRAVVAPPRWTVLAPTGNLVFTAGAVLPLNVMGFRAYTTMGQNTTEPTQMTAVFDSRTGGLRGLVVGARLGQLRTGAIGGVAAKYLARPEASIVGIIGSGPQARSQLLAVAAVRRIRAVRIYSPTQAHRNAFAVEMTRAIGAPIAPVNTAEAAVRDAQVVILATNSTHPVLDGQWLNPGAHVHSLGFKRKDRRELDETTFERAGMVVTDSPDQLASEGAQSIIYETPWADRVTDLAHAVIGSVKRQDERQITVFLSVGLAGTEVALAGRLLERSGK